MHHCGRVPLTHPDRPPSRGISPLHLRLTVARIVRTMRSLLRPSTLAITAGLLAMVLAGGCSSGLSKNECVTADWHMIGYEDGLHGLPAGRIGVHRVACAKFQVTPNLAAYTEGRERGLLEFCQPRNGFRVGLNGWSYANVCSAASEPPSPRATATAVRSMMPAPSCATPRYACDGHAMASNSPTPRFKPLRSSWYCRTLRPVVASSWRRNLCDSRKKGPSCRPGSIG